MIRSSVKLPLLMRCIWRFVLPTAALLYSCSAASFAQQTSSGSQVQAGMHIVADSPPYHLDFDGAQGAFVQRAVGAAREQRYSVTYLHTDPGPTGYSRHLAWFLGRDAKGFALIWCYLDDAGKDFWCWLYRYPDNTLTTQHFTGDYRFAAPTGGADTTEPGFSLPEPPAYTGPQFTFPGWTRKSGAIDKLDIFESLNTEPKSPTMSVTLDGATTDQKPTRTLQKLTIQPLHQLQVGGANGWRAGGWEELHAFAKDSAGDPYYLILYTNSKRGFVVDLKRARTYTANFGSMVTFDDDQKAYGPNGNPIDRPEVPSVKRNQVYEVPLATTKTYDNPYTDVVLDVELTGPDHRTTRIPGFWDGGKNWKIRFAPPKVGNWTWKTYSNDKDLDAKIGVLECMPETDPTVGFVHVHPYRSHSRHFAIGQSTNFYPGYIYDPVQFDPITAPAGVSGVRAISDARTSVSAPAGKAPGSFTAFQTRMDTLHGAGFNRLTGGYVLLGDTAIGEPRNEGGTAFLSGDRFRLNPEYFQWMDRRIAYCNSLGMVPDIGIARSPAIAFAANNDAQLRTLWRYLLARYSSYDVCWDLFGPVSADNSEALQRIQPFAQMAAKYDLFHHALTTELVVTDKFLKAGVPPAGTPKTFVGRTHSAEMDGPPLGLPLWLDVVTVQSGDLQTLYGLNILKKPIVVVSEGQPSGISDEEARAALWGARMRSAYYTIDQATGPAPALNSPMVKAMEVCNTFFKLTHYARLEPHMEMLAPHDETQEQRRRRHLANIQAGIPVTTGDPVSIKDATAPPPAALVLADPSREYVLYFRHGGNVTMDLLEATGHIKVFWLNLRTGESKEDTQIIGGSYHAFSAPDDKDWVLFLKRNS